VIALDAMVPELLDRVPLAVGDADAGLDVAIVELSIELPVESRIEPGAELHLCVPRGRLATGFDPHHGRLRARFVREDA
jgi:hypothetical protein